MDPKRSPNNQTSPAALLPRARPAAPQTSERRAFPGVILAYRINDAALVSGLSRSKLYELMTAKKLRAVKVGGRRLIPRDALEALLLGAA